MQGGAAQGIGWALWEVYDIDQKTGIIENPNFLDYKVPTSMDVPLIETVIVSTPNPNGPHGARGVGEIPLVTPVGAIGNAIYNITGVRLTETPFKSEKLLKALKAKG
jgi:CO/xanthine dehydrogenase Mo-binding subunit